jgi:Fe-S cluster assembly ATP-binding protein
MNELQIKNLCVSVENQQILKGVNLTIHKGETLALLGPNGHGKSTLLMTIMGHPRYKVDSGSIELDGEDLLKMDVDERAKRGLFMAFQNPPEVTGVETMDFFREMLNARRPKDDPVSLFQFYNLLKKNYAKVGLSEDMNTRHLNEGFSGGEKKRNEIMQMLLLNPELAMLDEIDSGLDVDSIRNIAERINEQKENGTSFLIISHYARLYSLIHPTRAAIMINGRIAVDGDSSLAERVDKEGYEWIQRELHISVKKEEPVKQAVLATCAAKRTK